MRIVCFTAVLAAALLIASQSSGQCATSSLEFSTSFRPTVINADLNDFGRIFTDAGSSNATCVETAHWALRDKVQNMLNGPADATGSLPFSRWLDGYYVALIYGAAFRLGEKGWATKDLDYVLDWSLTGAPTVASRFSHFTGVPTSGQCGPNLWNTCMDDHAGTAAGFAWMAAYKSKRPNHNSWSAVDAKRDAASSHISQALAAVCIRKKPLGTSGMPVCNGTVTDLHNGTGETLSVNGNQQIIHYGFGLMTTIGSALQALKDVVGDAHYLTPDELKIGTALFDEIRAHTNSSGNFITTDCYAPNGSGVPTAGVSCAGPDQYVPNLYKLEPVYRKYFSHTPAGGYTSTTFNSALFQRTTSTDDMWHFSYGRYATYYDMGYYWIEYGVPKFPGDAYDPIGYFESISATGLAQGWACDKDLGNRQAPIKVDFYINGGIYPPIASGWADSASEAEINGPNWCNGGTAHRFWVQLPPETQGYVVRAWALDYTWYGTYELPCLQAGGCRW